MAVNSQSKLLPALLLAFSVLGLIAAGYTSLMHLGGASSGICTIGEAFDCDLVNQSKWSKLAGIPVAYLGFLTYSIFFVSSIVLFFKRSKEHLAILVALGTVGVLFSLYLTYIEAFVLRTWCLFCVLSQIAVIGMAIISGLLYKQTSHVE
jgi:uncharacterized membrane protein